MPVIISQEEKDNLKQALQNLGLSALLNIKYDNDYVRLAQIVKLYKSGKKPQLTVDEALNTECNEDDIADMISYFGDPSAADNARRDNIEPLYTNSTFFQRYNEEKRYRNFSYSGQTSPHNAICDALIDKMYSPIIEGKSLSQLADMYPVKDGKGYFELFSDNLHKNLDAVIQKAVNKDEKAVNDIHNRNRAIEEPADEPAEEPAEKEAPAAEDNTVIDDMSFFNNFNNGGRVSLFDSEPEKQEEEAEVSESAPAASYTEPTSAIVFENEIAQFNKNGNFPSSLDLAEFSNGYEKAIRETNNAYAENDIKPENLAAPVKLIDNERSADYHAIANRIASDAKKAMQDAGVGADICDEYADMVAAQFKRLIVQSDYEQKCIDGCLFKTDLLDDIVAFREGSDKLPYFVEPDMVNKAAANALDYVKNKYQGQNFGNFSSDLTYDLDKPALVKLEEEYVFSVNVNVPDTISVVNDPPEFVINHADEFNQRITDARLVKDLNFKKLSIENMAPAVRMFDKFMQDNPTISKSINAPYVSEKYKKSYVNKEGKTVSVVDPTGLFFIEGQSVDKYLSSKVKGYKNYSVPEKQYVAKVAIMNALVTGKNVDVKNYVQEPIYKKCSAKISRVIYQKPNLNLMDKKEQAKQIEFDRKSEEAFKKRSQTILKNEAKTDALLLGNLNRYAPNRAETLHNYYKQQTAKMRAEEAERRREQGSRHERQNNVLNGLNRQPTRIVNAPSAPSAPSATAGTTPDRRS